MSFGVGLVAWLWTYEQLTVRGEGSPSPTARRTLKLVRTGIYAHSRNPSLYGKTLGVLAVDALNSFSFCFILALLLTGSLAEGHPTGAPTRQVFGEEYTRYKESSFLHPWKIFLPRTWKGGSRLNSVVS